MAGIIRSYWESIKTKVERYMDMGYVTHDMGSGGCFDEWARAMVTCDRESLARTVFERKPGEVVIPLDLDACVRATAALRQCMQRNPDVFKERIAAMDEGIQEEERRRREAEADPRFRWWNGLRNR